LEWKSCANCLESVILTENGNLVGYARFLPLESGTIVKLVISDSSENFKKCVGWLFGRFVKAEKLRIPMHPRSKILTGVTFEGTNRPIPPGMIAILDRMFEPIERYCRIVSEDSEQCGMATWPIGYDTL
jgi:hypothetical protein